ncbi:unnamed protein product, partial [Coregonus sp. 'balchen']
MFLRERLTAAAVEIFGVVEKTIVEYQEEITRSKEENERLHKMLDMVIKPQVKLHRAVNAHCSAAPSENMHGTEIEGPLQRKTKTGRPFRHIGTLSELKKRRA